MPPYHCPWEIIHTRGNAAIQSNRDHLFLTVQDNKYIDLSQPWWWTETIEPYFEVALKTRYASDSASSQCLDIIRSCMYKNFLYEYDLGNCGQLDYTQSINNTDTLASSYASAVEKSKANLQKKYDTFKANLEK